MISARVNELLSPASLFMVSSIQWVPPYPKNRMTTAYHEAAHAVCCVIIGIPIKCVKLEDTVTDGELGSVTLNLEGINVKNRKTPDSPICEQSEQTAAMFFAAVYAAGKMAELLSIGLRPTRLVDDDSNDFARARAILRKAYDSELPLFSAQQLAILILDHNWNWVSKVAEAVESKGCLDEIEVIALFGQAYPEA